LQMYTSAKFFEYSDHAHMFPILKLKTKILVIAVFD